MLSNGILPRYLRNPSVNIIGLHSFIVCYCFVQKSLPLLDNQIRESHQRATEELRQCGASIPSNEADKMFFLIEVSITRDSM